MPIITEGRAIIEAPPSAAWAALADYANDVLWRKAVNRMDQDPPGEVFEGAAVVEELRILGRVVQTRIEVHDVRPGSSFAWRAIDGSAAFGTRSVVPLGTDRCELRTWRQIGLTGADRLLQPLVAWVLRRAERADVRRAALVVEQARLA
ncbi:SRPBCC family protein [Microbacterium sp. BWT-B31]|uniref:SRPBCC family protein n=1 Tax=Microbacterium sp. BWT-B31 TaxID=3232072 RepID=UPI0035283315